MQDTFGNTVRTQIRSGEQDREFCGNGSDDSNLPLILRDVQGTDESPKFVQLSSSLRSFAT